MSALNHDYRFQVLSVDPGAPATYCISASEVKTFARVADTQLDSVIDLIIPGVQAYAEAATGRYMSPRSVKMTAEYPTRPGYYELSGYPIGSITSVKMISADGVETTVSAGDYAVSGTTTRSIIITGFSLISPLLFTDFAGHVLIEYTAGYDSTVKIPADTKLDILRLAATVLEHREDVSISDLGSYSAIPEIYSIYKSLNRRKRLVF